MMVSVVLKSEFSAAHLYEQKKWSVEKNQQTFGACYTEYGHGHNYRWEVTLLVPPRLSSSSPAFSAWVQKSQSVLNSITGSLDHLHLNFAVPEFREKVPTTENISVYLKEKLLHSSLSSASLSFRLFETETLWTQVQIQNPNAQA